MRRRSTTALLALGVAAALLTGCAADTDTDTSAEPAIPDTDTAVVGERLLQVTSVREETGTTLLEGPTFGPDGSLYVVDVTAPAGDPKVIRIDVETKERSAVFTDDSSVLTSAQFGPKDGRLYLTDMGAGRVVSITADGTDPQVVYSGNVEGTPLRPDDLTFDPDGNMFVSDFTALPGAGIDAAASGGRVVRIDGDTAEATVLADGLPSPNGISFNDDYTGLWVSQYSANRIDLLRLSEDLTQVVSTNPGMYIDGGRTQIDSNAVDASGNVYQGYHLRPGITVHGPEGEQLRTIAVPEDDAAGLESATNVAIAPGTTDGYFTVSGPSGGYVYTFDAVADGTRQSNGG